MGFLSSLDISASALTAQRLRMDVISQNIANANTTRTENGEPYRRRVVTFSERPADFSSALRQATGSGVVVSQITEDMSDFEYEYDPNHPDANADGYVAMPNVNETQEIIDLIESTRSYEANVTVLNTTKSMAMKAMELGG